MIINDRAILLDTGATPSNVTLFNDGPATVSYGVSETAVTDGTVASGASLDLPGPRWVKCAAGLRADARIVTRVVGPESNIAAWARLTMPTGALAETIPRGWCNIAQNTLVSGTMRLTPIYLTAGTVCTNITFESRGTAASVPLNQWFALYTKARVLLRQTVDDTTTAWAANTPKTLALTSPYTVPLSDLYLVAALVVATATPNLAGNDAVNILHALPPAWNGVSDAGLTTTAPNPAAAITASGGTAYAYVS